MQPMAYVEREILAGVDDVEARHPKQHRAAKQQRRAGKLRARIATQAASGASAKAAPSQKCANCVKRFA